MCLTLYNHIPVCRLYMSLSASVVLCLHPLNARSGIKEENMTVKYTGEKKKKIKYTITLKQYTRLRVKAQFPVVCAVYF